MQENFRFDSGLWSNNETFNLVGRKTGLDTQETKLPGYWNAPFSKICIGMKVCDHQFILINNMADSLYSFVADGQYRSTTLGRDTWKTLIGPEASLQANCNKEGFNVASGSNKARIGILGNNEDDCGNCDSRIGFGTAGWPDDSNTCGNEAVIGGGNGDKHIKTMGYIMAQ